MVERPNARLPGDLVWIYFVRARTESFALEGPIKIGHATSIAVRKSQINTDCPWGAELLHAVQAPRSAEGLVHALFDADRIRRPGEWFRPTDRLLEYIERLIRGEKAQEFDGAPAAARIVCFRSGCIRTLQHDSPAPYCGRRCLILAERALTAALKPPPPPAPVRPRRVRYSVLACERCGKDLTATQHKRGQRLCSKECQDEAARGQANAPAQPWVRTL